MTSVNITGQLKYFRFMDNEIPYLDVGPHEELKGTVLLVSGFSKNINSWISNIEHFRAKGYRVLIYDQSNVGRNLLNNGIQHFSFGEGLEYDAKLGVVFLKKLKVKNVKIVGHSRGAWVASRIVDLLARSRTLKVESLTLASPYVEYFWDSGYAGLTGVFLESIFDFTLEYNPGLIGLNMGRAAEAPHSHEKIKGLSKSLRSRALGYILKGTHPGSTEQKATTDFVKSAVKRGVRVKVITDAFDQDLAPLEVVSDLDLPGVDFVVLKEREYTHYWPEEFPQIFVKKVLED